MKKILITGASSGFGKAIAEKFASSGHEIIITGRRENLLNKLKEELVAKYEVPVTVLVFDVQNKKKVLIYNACFNNR